jgi:hypothetical protein
MRSCVAHTDWLSYYPKRIQQHFALGLELALHEAEAHAGSSHDGAESLHVCMQSKAAVGDAPTAAGAQATPELRARAATVRLLLGRSVAGELEAAMRPRQAALAAALGATLAAAYQVSGAAGAKCAHPSSTGGLNVSLCMGLHRSFPSMHCAGGCRPRG